MSVDQAEDPGNVASKSSPFRCIRILHCLREPGEPIIDKFFVIDEISNFHAPVVLTSERRLLAEPGRARQHGRCRARMPARAFLLEVAVAVAADENPSIFANQGGELTISGVIAKFIGSHLFEICGTRQRF